MITCMSFTSSQSNGFYNVNLTKENIPNYSIGNIPSIVPDAHYTWNNDGINAINIQNTQGSKNGVHSAADNQFEVKNNEYQNAWNVSTNGGNKPFNIIQPFTVTFFWKRIN